MLKEIPILMALASFFLAGVVFSISSDDLAMAQVTIKSDFSDLLSEHVVEVNSERLEAFQHGRLVASEPLNWATVPEYLNASLNNVTRGANVAIIALIINGLVWIVFGKFVPKAVRTKTQQIPTDATPV